MKRWKRMSLLAYGAEILILAAVLCCVFFFVPDLGKKKGENGERTDAASENTQDAYEEAEESTEAESALPEDLPENPPEGEMDSGTLQEQDGAAAGAQDGEKKREEKAERLPGRKRAAAQSGKGSQSDEEAKALEYRPPVLAVASDLHYQSPDMTDFLGAFDFYTEWNDGTAVPYLDSITDAFLEEIIMLKPQALILSGDISQNGERANHEALAKKLHYVQEAGVPVLVIPGNHDINHPWASTYFGDEKQAAEGVDADGFYEIYHEFGYDQASSRDSASLSYVYRLDERYWIMMLDSCIYEPVHKTGGRIKKETLSWMREQLLEAEAAGVTVIPAAHHNLLDESTLYPEECTLENGREVTALLEEFKVPVYLSGHMHLQRIKKHVAGPTSEGAYGIYEIVSSSLAIPPCQYGIAAWDEAGNFHYHTRQVDVSGWAKRYQEEDENLLDFGTYSRQFLTNTVAHQAFLGMEAIPEERKLQMAELYGQLNSAYCSGRRIDAVAVKKSEAYLFWSRYSGAGKWFDRLNAILKDTKRDHNELTIEAEKEKE